MKIHASLFDTIEDLQGEKDILLRHHKKRRDKLEKVRGFTNGLSLLTPEQAEEQNVSEITNHMMGHRNLQGVETQIYSIYSNSRRLVEIKVDTNNAEIDHKLSEVLTKTINDAIYHSGKFGNLWRSVAGELLISSVAPLIQKERQGWCPKLSPNILLPKGTGYTPSEITYAFVPREMTVADLQRLRNAVPSEGESKFIDVKTLDKMLEALKSQIKEDSTGNTSNGQDEREYGGSIEEQTDALSSDRKTTFNTWWYYEVVAEGSKQVVTSTLFTEATSVGGVEIPAQVVASIPKAYNAPSEWLHFVVADSEIGGVKTIDTARGMAELTFNADMSREELVNALIEGAKEKARPKYQNKGGNVDDILGWSPAEDSLVPEGIEEFKTHSNANDIAAPLQLLSQTSAQLSSGGVSNTGRGGETRNQTLERQENTGTIKLNRISDVYKSLDRVLTEVVRRFLELKVKEGTEDYEDFMWVRERLEEEINDRFNINYKDLLKRTWGRYKYLQVKAIRVIGDGDRNQELQVSSWMMDQLTNIQPALRPHVIQKAIATVTRDPDLAEFLVQPPSVILNAQKVIAENEYDLIRRRSALGEMVSVSPDDIHQDHIPIHIKDLQAHLSQTQFRPWDKLDVLQFGGMVEHIGEHLQILLGNPVTINEAKQYVQALQQIVQTAEAEVKAVEEREGNEAAQMTPKEQADVEIKVANLQLQAEKLGLSQEMFSELVKSREQRHALASRGQFTKEISENRRLNLQEKQIDKPDTKPDNAQSNTTD